MPIQINQAVARDLSPQLDDALQIVCNEFEGLDAHRGYHNAFARVLKPDPLRRVLMLGTEKRDLFVPLLRRTMAEHVPTEGQIFDFATGVARSLQVILRFLKPGGAYFSVVTDEATAFSGSVLRSFIESGGDAC
jgi:hypothetical protein